MSYILDALKRAEAERDRGAVPTLNTQGASSAGAVRSAGTLLYVAIGVGVLLVLLLGLLLWRGSGAAPEPQAAAQSQPQIAQVQPPAPLPQAAQRNKAPPPAARKPTPAIQPAPAPVRAAAPAPAPVLTMAELPDAVRRSLPPLKFGGAMYSDAPASRVLILNGQLLHEGESVQPGLVIETIGVHKATLNQNGQRFSIDY